MENYKRLLIYIKPYLKRLGIAIICIVMAAAANLYVPWIIKDMIDQVLAEKNMALLNLIAIGIVVVFFFRGIFYFGQSYLVAYIGQRVIIDVREVMFRKFQRMPMAYFDKHQTGETMSYVTNDVAAIQAALVDNLIELFTESSILIGSIGMMFYLDWKLSMLTLITVPLVGVAMRVFGRKIKANGTVIQERMADITSLLQESISSIRVVKSFVREDYEIKRFCDQNELNFQAVMKNVQLNALLTPTVEFLAALAVTALVWYGGYEVVNGVLTAGELVAFLTYAVNLANPVKRLSRIYGRMQKALAAVDRIFYVLDLEEAVNDKPDAKVLPPVSGHVALKEVSFSYDGTHNALENVTFDVKPGQMIAFVGPSGAVDPALLRRNRRLDRDRRARHSRRDAELIAVADRNRTARDFTVQHVDNGKYSLRKIGRDGRRSSRGGTCGECSRVHRANARRISNDDRRTRAGVERRAEAEDSDSSSDTQRPADIDLGRGDVGPRHGIGENRAGGAR